MGWLCHIMSNPWARQLGRVLTTFPRALFLPVFAMWLVFYLKFVNPWLQEEKSKFSAPHLHKVTSSKTQGYDPFLYLFLLIYDYCVYMHMCVCMWACLCMCVCTRTHLCAGTCVPRQFAGTGSLLLSWGSWESQIIMPGQQVAIHQAIFAILTCVKLPGNKISVS